MSLLDLARACREIAKIVNARITPEIVTEYRQNGCVVIRSLLRPDHIALLRAGIERNIQSPGPLLKVVTPPGLTSARFFEDFRNFSRIPEYQHFLRDSPLAAAASRLLDSQEIRLFHDHLLVKEDGSQCETPWHQDLPYYNIEGDQSTSAWVSIDPIPRHHSLRIVKGSHKWGWFKPTTFDEKREARWFQDLPELPIIDDTFAVASFDVEPGDVVFFDMLAVHSTPAAQGLKQRRVFSARFVGDDVTFAPRPWTTSPDFPELRGVLPAGSPLQHPSFPPLWGSTEENLVKLAD